MHLLHKDNIARALRHAARMKYTKSGLTNLDKAILLLLEPVELGPCLRYWASLNT